MASSPAAEALRRKQLVAAKSSDKTPTCVKNWKRFRKFLQWQRSHGRSTGKSLGEEDDKWALRDKTMPFCLGRRGPNYEAIMADLIDARDEVEVQVRKKAAQKGFGKIGRVARFFGKTEDMEKKLLKCKFILTATVTKNKWPIFGEEGKTYDKPQVVYAEFEVRLPRAHPYQKPLATGDVKVPDYQYDKNEVVVSTEALCWEQFHCGILAKLGCCCCCENKKPKSGDKGTEGTRPNEGVKERGNDSGGHEGSGDGDTTEQDKENQTGTQDHRISVHVTDDYYVHVPGEW